MMLPPPPPLSDEALPPPPSPSTLPPPSMDDAPPPPPPPAFAAPEVKPLVITKSDKPMPPAQPDARSQLLDAIRGPAKLKHVTEDQKKPLDSVDADDQNVLNILAKALIARRQHIDKKVEEHADEDENLEDWM
eukprot:TRINITY_DN4003_c0_g1_i5.p1 TRINITY_DN4003_c0_g1~~TRINITY_DN4003_c0_g1_i5.p1  ORF type:complete len:133 (+),score=60.81 TRINITY_DN4003_c0_g1_i5:150-548(+)